jgi:hypothetical protein
MTIIVWYMRTNRLGDPHLLQKHIHEILTIKNSFSFTQHGDTEDTVYTIRLERNCEYATEEARRFHFCFLNKHDLQMKILLIITILFSRPCFSRGRY